MCKSEHHRLFLMLGGKHSVFKYNTAVVQSLHWVWLSATPWTVAHRFPLSSSISQSLIKFMSIDSVMLFNHLILCHSPFAFSLSQHQVLFQWVPSSHQGVQSIGDSASVLPMNSQGWLPLGLTGLISLQSEGLSRVFSNTTVQKLQFSVLSLLYGPTLTSIHGYWKNYSFDYMDFCWQNDVSAF